MYQSEPIHNTPKSASYLPAAGRIGGTSILQLLQADR